VARLVLSSQAACGGLDLQKSVIVGGAEPAAFLSSEKEQIMTKNLNTLVELSNALANDITEVNQKVVDGEYAISVLKEQLRIAEVAHAADKENLKALMVEYRGVKALVRTLEDCDTTQIRNMEDKNLEAFD
jgi:hypothetical protein